VTALPLDVDLTVGAARRALARAFGAEGIETPDLDARLLIAHALGVGHAGLVAAASRDLTREERDTIAAYALRRLNREPVARIVGCKEFWSLTLTITDAVLVPRPETETVVEAALSIIEARGHPLRIADMGTGSGALLLALLSELPNAFGVGVDRDAAALIVARTNADRLGLAQRAAFALADYGRSLAGAFDFIVSNPPYVATSEIGGLAREVRDYDPHLALDGGLDGLEAYRTIAGDADRLLAPGGGLCVEIGAGQADAVAALLTAAGLTLIQPAFRDLAGIPRVICAQKKL
jgi:release factor glutamine methyltransferase